MQVGDLVKFARAGRGKMATQVGIVVNLKYKRSPFVMMTAEVLWPHGGRSNMRSDIFEVVSHAASR